jgi:hypothetical protein
LDDDIVPGGLLTVAPIVPLAMQTIEIRADGIRLTLVRMPGETHAIEGSTHWRIDLRA